MTDLDTLRSRYHEIAITYSNSEMCDVQFTARGLRAPPHPFVQIYVEALKGLLHVPQAELDRWLQRSQLRDERLRVGPCSVSISGFSPPTPELWPSVYPNQHVRYLLMLPQVPEWEQCGLGELLKRVPEHLRVYIGR